MEFKKTKYPLPIYCGYCFHDTPVTISRWCVIILTVFMYSHCLRSNMILRCKNVSEIVPSCDYQSDFYRQSKQNLMYDPHCCGCNLKYSYNKTKFTPKNHIHGWLHKHAALIIFSVTNEPCL